jgi:hypothetical protein
MRGLVVAGVIAAACFVAAPASGALVVRDDVDSVDITFIAGDGEENRLVARQEPTGVRFVDSAAVLTTMTCTLVNPHEVFCPGLAETLLVELGGGNDVADVVGTEAALVDGGAGDDRIVASSAFGGEGNDVLRGTGAAARLRGGPGDDTIVGGPGNDTIAVDAGVDRLDGGLGNDRYVVDAGARGITATIADAGGRDSIAVGCAGAKVTVGPGTRDRRGRYVLPGGTVTFVGLDGTLPCVLPKVAGLSLVSARRALSAAGFRVGRVTYRRSTKVRRGRVISLRRTGATIALVVSSGRG